jgi:signal transduction histidine kinase
MEGRPRILVVDDEPRSRELLVRTLRKSAETASAASADEAFALFVAEPFQLVITDQRMPGASGVDLLSRLAERDEHVGRILLTGYSDLAATVEAINRGRVHAYLHKPCSPEEIRLTVTAVLERTRLAQENQRLVKLVSAQNTELMSALQFVERAQARLVASERLAAVGKMVAMLAHDLRTPLAVLLSVGREVQQLAAERGLGEIGELGGQVVEHADDLRRTCDGLVESVQAGQGGRAHEMTSLDDVVSDAIAMLSEPAGASGVEIDLDLRARVQLPLDPIGLRRALQNLALNAIEAMPRGGKILVQTDVVESRARIRVSDTGPGIPEAIADRLFEAFVTSGKAKGSGLGLAVVREVVDQHRGDVSVDKAEGGGACFEILLPLAAEAQ